MERPQLIDALGDWIDKKVIAETIIEAMEEERPATLITLGDAQCVWLDMLEHLPAELQRSARYALKS